MKDTLAEALGVIPMPQKQLENKAPVSVNDVILPDQEHDYQLSRETFHELIRRGSSAIESIECRITSGDSLDPKLYEAYATMLKTVSDVTKNLYDLQRKTKELKEKDAPKKVLPTEPNSINVEKAVFVGSSVDLLRQAKGSKE